MRSECTPSDVPTPSVCEAFQLTVKTISLSSYIIESTIALAIVTIPLAGIFLAGWFAWGRGLFAFDLLLTVALYSLTMLGITVGYHRLFTHKSFQTTRTLQALLGVLGSMALQGPIIRWVADHRRHHAFSDAPGDPHSPHLRETSGLLPYLRACWHAHIGWFFSRQKTVIRRFAPDLLKDPWTVMLDRHYWLWAFATLALPTAAGWLAVGTAHGALRGFVWGGLTRLFLVHHATWSVNSICHLFGSRPNPCDDESRNNAWVALLVFGEGWHNNHHAIPSSARHGWSWRQVDLSYLVILGLAHVGLAWGIKLSPQTAIHPDSSRTTCEVPENLRTPTCHAQFRAANRGPH
jgi:stearoyl-CoA desaturase (delta-9 desaturase)